MTIDFHSHFIPAAFPPLPDGVAEPAWPQMTAEPDGGATMSVGGKPFRRFDPVYWDVPSRLATMDAAGTDLQVISPLPELLSYWLAPAAGIRLTDAINAACAVMVAAAPARLRGLGILALQDPGAACRQLEQIARTDGMVGVFVGSNVNGASIASAAFDPVFERAAALGLVVFVHGVRPAGLERMEGPALMGAVLGVSQESAAAAASFMMRDILGRCPGLRLVFSHGGGGLGAVLDRMNLVWEKFPAMRETLTIPPVAYARRFWFDTVVFGPEYLRYLAGRFGADRLIAGSDGPTEIGQNDLPAFIGAAGLDVADRHRILGGNALELLMRGSRT